MAYRSGVMTCDSVAHRVEVCARRAHYLAKLDPDKPRGPADLLICMVRPRVIEFLDLGIPHSKAEVTFGVLPMEADAGEWPVRVRMLDRQRPELLRVACAHACAQIVEWTLNESWGDGLMTAITHAIILPAKHVLAGIANVDAEALARHYTVDVGIVQERLRVLRATRGSGQRPAMVVGTPNS